MSDAQEWLEDAADLEDACVVHLDIVAYGKGGIVYSHTDLEVTGEQAAIMFRAVARHEMEA